MFFKEKKSNQIFKDFKDYLCLLVLFFSVFEVFKTSLAVGASTLVGQQFLTLEESQGFGGSQTGVKREALLCEKQ